MLARLIHYFKHSNTYVQKMYNLYVYICIKYISFNLLEIKRAPVLSWLMELTEKGLE